MPTHFDVLPPEERVSSRAYMYSALNVGFTLGSLTGGIALAFIGIATGFIFGYN